MAARAACRLDEKEALLASGDPAFSTTPHYDGYGAVLVDLDRIDRARLAELVEDAWRYGRPPAARHSARVSAYRRHRARCRGTGSSRVDGRWRTMPHAPASP